MPGSDFTQDAVMTLILGTGAGMTKPAALWVALYTTTPGDTDVGVEVSGGNYGRVQRDASDANWPSSGTGTGKRSNAAAITFPTPNASWGTVTHWGLRDASTAGNLIFYDALQTSRAVGATDPAPVFAAGDLSVTAI